MAKPSLFTPRRRTRYLKGVRRGLPRHQASHEAGWGERTGARYLRYGRERPGTVWADFLRDVAAAEEAFRAEVAAMENELPGVIEVELQWGPQLRVVDCGE